MVVYNKNTKEKKYYIDIVLKNKEIELGYREETKVWQYSTVMLVQLFNEERPGSLVLPEV